jgi:phosphoserine phosphatase
MTPSAPVAPVRHAAPGLVWRGAWPPPRLSDFRVAAFDMDSTLIGIECIDELAAAAGRGSDVAAITAAAMRGEITDWRESLDRRLAALAGVPWAAVERLVAERLEPNPGVVAFVEACHAAGLVTLIVSGGFTACAWPLARRLGIRLVRAGELEAEGEGAARRLTGRLVPQAFGTHVDGAEKRRTLLELCSLLGVPPAQAIAVGDGANDLPMMRAAGCSIAFHAKPVVRAEATLSIETGGLDRALEVFSR